MSKKINIPKDKLKALEGFEDIIELFDDVKVTNNSITSDKGQDNYEIYNFLESEINRHIKLNELLTKKVESIRTNEQTHYLIQTLENKKSHIKTGLFKELAKPESTFMKEINRLWTAAFSDNQ